MFYPSQLIWAFMAPHGEFEILFASLFILIVFTVLLLFIKALAPIEVILLPMFIVSKLLFRKACCPIVVTLFGMVKVPVKLLFSKAWVPITFKFSLNIKVLIWLLLKAKLSMASTVSGKITVLNLTPR